MIRADDTRLSVHRGRGRNLRAGDSIAIEGDELGVELDAGAVRELCGPVRLPWPGLPVREAAAKLGVSTWTVYRWGKPAGREKESLKTLFEEARDGVFPGCGEDLEDGQWDAREMRVKGRPGLVEGRLRRVVGRVLTMDQYVNRADRKRDEVLFWSHGPVWPGDGGGGVWSAEWGE